MSRTKSIPVIAILAIAICLIGCTALGPHYECTYNGQKFKTYSIFRPFVGLNEYRGGSWGEWRRDTYLRYEVSITTNGTEITYYQKYSHPSDFEYKIILKHSKPIQCRNGNVWHCYEGEFQVRKSHEEYMKTHYTNKVKGLAALKDVWVFPASINCTSSELPDMKYIYPTLPSAMQYTYNVWYNGVARGFDIYGKWIGADRYDDWK